MVVNQAKLFSTIIVLLLLHIPVAFIYKKCKFKRNWCGKLATFVFKLFTFTIYLRTIIEAYLVLMLTSFNEFYAFDLSSGKKCT